MTTYQFITTNDRQRLMAALTTEPKTCKALSVETSLGTGRIGGVMTVLATEGVVVIGEHRNKRPMRRTPVKTYRLKVKGESGANAET